MFFAPFFALFFFFASFGLVASVPSTDVVGISKRQASTAAIAKILDTLKTSTDTFLTEINDLVHSGTASEANVVPVFTNLTTAVTTAVSSLTSLEISGRKVRRQSDADIASIIAAIFTDVADGVRSLITRNAAALAPSLGSLISTAAGFLTSIVPGLLEATSPLVPGLPPSLQLAIAILNLILVLLADL